MAFWFFMFIMVLLIPAAMAGSGRMFMKKAPDNVNMLFGYRTSRSIKNKDTWVFAHKYIGKLWLYGGMIILPFSIVPMFFCLGKPADTIGAFGGIIVALQMIPMIGTIISTEKALKTHFDEFGKRR